MDMIERIKRRISLASTEACGYTPLTRVISLSEVEEILKQEGNKWIAVSERLPEEGKEVIVTMCMDNDNKYVYIARRDKNIWRANGGIPLCFTKVLAWMPLPESYNDGDQGKQINAIRTQGVLIAHPMVGEQVYAFLPNNDNYFVECQIDKIEIRPTLCGNVCYFLKPTGQRDTYRFFEDDLGENVFLEKEEAENKMKEKENGYDK